MSKAFEAIMKTKQVQAFANQVNTQAKSIMSSEHIEHVHNQIVKVQIERRPIYFRTKCSIE